MKNFKDLGVHVEKQGFVGNKIKINKILNKEIIVHKFKVIPSKFDSGKCLNLQIEVDGTKHVLFTGSGNLIGIIEKIDADHFPFKTTIIEENDCFYFS